MLKYHVDNMGFRKKVKFVLEKYGINVNIENGKICREQNVSKVKIGCEAVYLLRHAKTLGTMNKVFMSNDSNNSHIIYEGIKELIENNKDINRCRFDSAIICCDIPRVKETGEIFKLLNPNILIDEQKKFKGINNGGWENKTEETLKGIDLNDYIQREKEHNIFAKSSNGESWAQVLLNCVDLIEYLNKNYKNKRVLLISQGSIFIGLKILTSDCSIDLWKDYDAKKIFNLHRKDELGSKNYSKINLLYDLNRGSIEKVKTGLVYGRFQVLHYGHMDYILSSLEKCEHLIIGICNPEKELTKYSASCPHRSKLSSNPLTYYERMECIKGALLERGISASRFDIVPFPINFPEKIYNYAPMDAKYFIPVFELWGEENVKTFRDKLGVEVEVILKGTLEDKKDNATDVRKMIYNNEDWSKNVPNFVYKYIKEHKIDLRIKELIEDEKNCTQKSNIEIKQKNQEKRREN